MRTYDNIRKITTGQGDDYSTGFLLDYNYFNNYYKIIAMDLNTKHLMLIQKQYRKLILLKIQIEQKVQQCFSLLQKQKTLFQIFHKELEKYCECVPRFYFVLYKMTQHNTFNVKLSNLQLNKLQS